MQGMQRNMPGMMTVQQGMPIRQGMVTGRLPDAIQAEQPMALAARPKKMTEERIAKATKTLIEYKNGKSELDQRMLENEKWWDARAWNEMQQQGNGMLPQRPTMWLFNVVLGKHADMVAGYPEPTILPREKRDENTARILSSIVPVVMEQNDFDETYNMQAWEKNKSGTAVYSVTYDTTKHNGLGDISIGAVDIMNLFWQPGINHIQKSRNVFQVLWVDKETLVGMYPQLEGKNLDGGFTLEKYDTEDSQNRENNMALVVDWYYHTHDGGKKTLHYCKYVGSNILYASEDDVNYQNGWYEDGMYPYVVDRLFPIKGSIAGRGYIDIGKNAQETIDLLDQAMVMNSLIGAIPRFLISEDSPVNAKQFLDLRNPFIQVPGSVADTQLRQIDPTLLSSVHVTMLQNKIEELKQTTGNQDVVNGSAGSVTAASAVAALQESAGRSSRDGIKGTWRAYANIVQMVISRMRQFYSVERTFRIIGEGAAMEYASISNASLIPRPVDYGEYKGMHIPEFDIHVGAQRQNEYSKMAQNELALQLLNAGVFSPQLADQSLMLLETMDFNGREELMEKVKKNGTMLQMMAMWQQIAIKLASKYEPETAEQLAASVAGGAGMPVNLPAVEPEMNTAAEESEITRKARERSAQASQPA